MKYQAMGISKILQTKKEQVLTTSSPTASSSQFLDARKTNKHQIQLKDVISKGTQQSIDQHSDTIQKKDNTTGLSNSLKSGIEHLSGMDISDVKVHYNSNKPAQLNAHAYAQGTDIHVATGQEKYLPHEAWHVVQQKQGRVQPTRQMRSKVNINDDPQLEKEADIMGEKALRVQNHEGTTDSNEGNSIQTKPYTTIQSKVAQLGKDRKKNKKSKKKKPVRAHEDDQEEPQFHKKKSKKQNKKDQALDQQTKTLNLFPESKQESESDTGWGVDQWDEPTLIKAAEILLQGDDVPKLKAALEGLKKYSGDSHMLKKIKTELQKIEKKEIPCPIEESTLIEQATSAEEESKQANTVISSLVNIHPESTKKKNLTLPEDQFHDLVKTGSAGARLKDMDSEQLGRNFLTSLQEDHSTSEEESSTVDIESKTTNPFLELTKKKPLFYGTTEGQRIHVLAAQYMQGKAPSEVDAKELGSHITQDLASGTKEKWPQVSNFWLDGSANSGVGLAGTRASEQKLSAEEASQHYSSELQILQKIIDLKNAQLSTDEHQNMKKLFVAQFRLEQAALGKDWTKDVRRPSYKHKPGTRGGSTDEIAIYEDLICRRMCKWMLHVAVYNDQPVIYSLNEIHMPSVAKSQTLRITDNVTTAKQKTPKPKAIRISSTDSTDSTTSTTSTQTEESKDDGKKEKLPVCTSELREIFRAQDRLMSDDSTRGVKFYKNMLPVSAPWMMDKDKTEADIIPWAEYAMHLTRKLLHKYPGDEACLNAAKKMIADYNKKNWSAIISSYKALKPSELRAQGLSAIPYKKDRGARLATHDSRLKKGSVIKEVPGVLKALETCIRELNELAPLQKPKGQNLLGSNTGLDDEAKENSDTSSLTGTVDVETTQQFETPVQLEYDSTNVDGILKHFDIGKLKFGDEKHINLEDRNNAIKEGKLEAGEYSSRTGQKYLMKKSGSGIHTTYTFTPFMK